VVQNKFVVFEKIVVYKRFKMQNMVLFISTLSWSRLHARNNKWKLIWFRKQTNVILIHEF